MTGTSSSSSSYTPPAGSLPADFTYGFATASYQIEGGHDEDGRLPSVWDDLCRKPGAIADGTNGDEAIDSYHLYPQDVELLAAYGANSYRFSISWSRVIPLGGRNDPVNEAGIAYYNKLIDLLVSKNIRPYVTIFHWDLPSELEKRYGGWTNTEEVSKDFERYSRVLFERFGDRVKDWITLNEPWCVGMFSASGLKPGWVTEKHLYPTAHSLIWSHALAVQLYRKEFKPKQGGQIGVTLNCDWCEPIDDTPEAKECAQRRLDQALGWYADPIYLGHYPESIQRERSDVLPEFTQEQWAIVKGSSDFFGLNSYSTNMATGERDDTWMNGGVITTQTYPDGRPMGNIGQCSAWLQDVPWGFGKLLRYCNKRYLQPTGLSLIVTEQGFCVKGEQDLPIEKAIHDQERIDYYKGYLKEVIEARNEGIPVVGYFAWSLADNREFSS